jgi:hypothetical protein
MKKHGIIAGGIAVLTILLVPVLLGCGGGSRSTDSYSPEGEAPESEEGVLNTELEPEYLFGEWMMPSEVGIVGTVLISQDKFRWEDPVNESYQEMAVDNWEPVANENSGTREFCPTGFRLTGKTKSNVADLRVDEIIVYLSNDGQSIMQQDDEGFPVYYQKKTAQATAELEDQLARIQQEVEQARKDLENAASREAFVEKAKQKASGWLQKGKELFGRAKGALGGLLDGGGIVDKTGGAIEILDTYPSENGTYFVFQNTTDKDLTVSFEPFYENGLPIGNSLLGMDFNVLPARAGETSLYMVMDVSPEQIGKLVINLK